MTVAKMQNSQDTIISPFRKILLFTVGVGIVSLIEIASQFAKNDQGKFSFSLPTVILFSEFIKTILSFTFLIREVGLKQARNELSSSSFKEVFLFLVPAACYTVSNNIAILAGRYMDGASQAVLNQLKTLTTAILWFMIFKKPLMGHQLMGLVCLVLSAVASVFPTGEDMTSKMHVEYTGLVLMSIASISSSIAGCYSEWVYKNVGVNKSIHLQNIFMYAFGMAWNLITFMMSDHYKSGRGFFDGWNGWSWVLVGNFACMGLIMSMVLRYFTSIHKLFMSGAAIYFCTLANVFIFKLDWSMQFGAAMVLCTVAIFMYNKPQIIAMISREKVESKVD